MKGRDSVPPRGNGSDGFYFWPIDLLSVVKLFFLVVFNQTQFLQLWICSSKGGSRVSEF